MSEIIKFEDWAKLELVIGIVKKIKDKTIINCGKKDFQINLDLNLKNGEKIVVGIDSDNILIPLVGDNIPIVPEEEIEVGSRVR